MGGATAKEDEPKGQEVTVRVPPDEDVPMPRQEPQERVKNFKEVALGYTEEMARKEAARCLRCKNPQCRKGCPVDVPIPEFIECISHGKYAEGIAVIKSKNALPAICGRVCPQEGQCQMRCVKGKKGDPVNIGRLERFLADWEREHEGYLPQRVTPTGTPAATNPMNAGTALHEQNGVITPRPAAITLPMPSRLPPSRARVRSTLMNERSTVTRKMIPISSRAILMES